MNEEQIPEPQYLDIDWNIGDDKYNYNFNKLSAIQILVGKMYFSLEMDVHEKIPHTPDEFEALTKRRIQRFAFSSIVNKREDENTFEKYVESNPPSIHFLDNIVGETNYQNVMNAREDFFYRTGLFNRESMMGLGDLMQQLNQLSEVERIQVLKLAGNFQDSNDLKTNAKNTTKKKTTEKH